MILTAMCGHTITDFFHHPRKLVGAYVRVGVDENVFGRAEIHELMEHLAYVATLGRAGVEFTVRKSTCPALSVAIIGVGIHNAFA